MINSRAKGARGEREFAAYLKKHNIDARRGQQYAGGTDSPDVISDLTNVHFEVKCVAKGNPWGWLDQALRDGKGKLPIVAHKRNHKGWMAVLKMDDLIDLLLYREGALICSGLVVTVDPSPQRQTGRAAKGASTNSVNSSARRSTGKRTGRGTGRLRAGNGAENGIVPPPSDNGIASSSEPPPAVSKNASNAGDENEF